MSTVRINLTRIEVSCADCDVDTLRDLFPNWDGDLNSLSDQVARREPDFAGVLEGAFPMFAATANYVEDIIEVVL